MNEIEVINLVLEGAAREAVSACYREIAPAHLLIALSRLSELDSNGQFDVANLRLQFEMLGIEPSRFRRRLRALLGNGGSVAPETPIHRSPDCKAVFAGAQSIAVQRGTHLTLELLLNAILLFLARIARPEMSQESEIECPYCYTRMRLSFAGAIRYCSACGTKVDFPPGARNVPGNEIPTEL
jgi:hypothetical protein